MKIVAIVPAAGEGTRLGTSGPKALIPVGGTPLVTRAVRGLLAPGCADSVVVAAPPQYVQDFTAAVSHAANRCRVVPGGPDRTASVRRAIDAIEPGSCDALLVHDAARAFTPASVTRKVVAGLESGTSAVVPTVAVADTLKLVNQHGVVTATQDRAALRAVQTPQGFSEDVLRKAHVTARANQHEATDDASLVERLGITVTTVKGHAHAMKITTQFDLAIAEAVLAAEEPAGEEPAGEEPAS